MSRQTSTADYVTISAEDMARFHRNAAAAVQRRSGGYVAESFGRSFELIVMGAVPIVGMLWLDWSAAQLLVFLLAAAWVGILCDLARLTYAGRGVKQFAQTHYDDWHVWVVVEALRAGRTTAPKSYLQARYEPWAGVFVDLVAGGVASVLMCFFIANSRIEGGASGLLGDRSLLVSLACMAGYQALAAAWEIVRHCTGGPDAGPVAAQPGIRGCGLFILMFVMLIAGDAENGGDLAAERIMLVVNGAIVLFGVLNTVGLLWLRPETNWLRNYLRDRPRDVAAAPATMGNGTQRKKRKTRRGR